VGRPNAGALTLDEKTTVVVPSISDVHSTDSDTATAAALVGISVGGFTPGAGDPVPQLLSTRPRLAVPRAIPAAALLINQLQSESALPLLTTADFEGGVGYIVNGGTRLPRAMALGATRDTDLAFRAGQVSGGEGRSLGVHVNFYPVVDVSNNAIPSSTSGVRRRRRWSRTWRARTCADRSRRHARRRSTSRHAANVDTRWAGGHRSSPRALGRRRTAPV
jgi:hypothetical protein